MKTRVAAGLTAEPPLVAAPPPGDGAAAAAVVVWPVLEGEDLTVHFDTAVVEWAAANDWSGKAGEVLLVPPPEAGQQPSALLGLGDGSDPLVCGWLPRRLPRALGRCRIDWTKATSEAQRRNSVLAYGLGGYVFRGYAAQGPPAKPPPALELDADCEQEMAVLRGAYLARDLINMPASHLSPEVLQHTAESLAGFYGGRVKVVAGAELEDGFPLIHAVGRAAADAARAPRLIDLTWKGAAETTAPRITLVGKGVTFDTGGLDLKPPAGMIGMKKDMGGAANVLGLAAMVMASGLPVRLRVLVPAVENSVAGNAMRPSDVLRSRKGLTVEIGNTDAEGRLILADALALADEEAPDLLVDMATLTGAHRVALGWDLPGVFTDDEVLAAELARHGAAVADPTWRLPLWRPYAEKLKSKVADVNNIPSDAFGGAISAALFLQKFVEKAGSWVHIDFNGVNKESSAQPEGGADQGIRSLFAVLAERYGR